MTFGASGVSDTSLALINNLPAIIAAVGSLISAVATAYIILTQRGHREILDQLLENQHGIDHDHNI